MMSRPSLLAFGPTLGAVVLVGAIGFAPIVVSHDTPPGAPVRFWWARLAPRGYAVHALRSAPAVIIPVTSISCPDPESSVRAWLTVAAGTDAEHVFRRLFASPQAETRFYALLGLAHARSPILARALTMSQQDSSMVRIVFWPAPEFKDTTVAFSIVSSAERVDSLTQMLARLGPACAA